MMHPAHDCRVRHRQAAFGHHPDQVSEAEFEAQVQPHAQHDDLAIEVATLKQLIETWEPGHRPALYSPDGGQDWEASKLHQSHHEHRHIGIRYVTPSHRHAGLDGRMLAARHAVYQDPRTRNPQRWSGQTRNWTPVGVVTLNPERDTVVQAATSQILLPGSIGEPAFSSRPGSAQATARNEGDGRSGATRSHAQRALSRASMARLASTGPSPQ
jgi:hypothetical protein